MADESWAPANDTEVAMLDAVLAGDARRYLEILSGAVLYLPAFEEAGPQRLVTFQEGDATCLPVFTSGEAMALRLSGIPAYRTTTHRELVEKWPDPAWVLAVDPGLPIGGMFPLPAIAEALSDAVPVTPMEPIAGGGSGAAGNDLERDLLSAIAEEDMDALARVLILADVYLPTTRPVTAPVRIEPGFPWRLTAGQPPTVAVFTSADLLERALPGAHHVAVPLLDIALGWPDDSWQLAVNPGWPVALTLPGNLVQGLVARAATLVADAPHAEQAPPDSGQVPQMLVKVLPEDQVEWYLRGNWHQVTGRMFPFAAIRAARTPVEVRAALGGYLPFRPDAPTVHLILWNASCPALYRTQPDGSLRGRAVTLPHGARLYRLDAQGMASWLASFDADTGRWVAAADTTTLRRAMSGGEG